MMNKKETRRKFKAEVFKRDNYTCQICGHGNELPEGFNIDPSKYFDAHHITDRSKMPNGGYVKENGITVCKEPIGLVTTDGSDGLPDWEIHDKSCHMRCEEFHISNGSKWEENLHPDDLYRLIGSSHELAYETSKKL
jgi:5-methylcytosine-specific restriction endonuclease McrA